jgi:hypothetical protein
MSDIGRGAFGGYLNGGQRAARKQARPSLPLVRLVSVADKDPLVLEEYYAGDLDDEVQPTNWDDIDLEEMFDLPPVLPPVRLPEEAELAAQARGSALLADLRALAGDVRTTTVPEAAVNPVLLWLAEEAELVERDGEDLVPGEDAGWLDALADDDDALDAWEDMFAEVLDTTLGLERPEDLFEAISRLDHPDAEAVLALIGKHASDKTTAKAARRAAYKASTRRAVRR